METRNKKSKNQGVEQEAEEETEEMSRSITIDQGQFATLMNSLQQSQAEIFARLIQEVRTSTPAPDVSMTTAAANFSKCTARFNGTSADVDGFIDAIEVYKNCLQISDDNAVKGLSMLLVDSAALWWQGIKTSTTSWSDAMQKLKSAFGEHRPPFRIYLELFSLRQNTDTTDLFVAKTRALLSRLPQEDLREKVQLDMVYGLLDRRIKKRLDRNSISSFDQLLHRARAIEESLVDSACDKTPALTQPSASHQSTVTGSPSTSAPSDKNTRSKRLSCSYCKKWGHEKSQCNKLVNRNKSDNVKSDNGNSDENINKNKAIQCYGCGTPNVIKSKCEKCKSSSQNAFCSVTTTSDSVNSKVRGSCHRVIMRDECASPSGEPRSTAESVLPAPPAQAPQSPCGRAGSADAVAARCLATNRERTDNVPRGRKSPGPPRIVPAGTTGNLASCNAGDHLKLYCDCVTELRNNIEHSSVSNNVCYNNNRDTKFSVSSDKTLLQHGHVIQSDDNDKVAISCCMNNNRNIKGSVNVQSDCLCSSFCDKKVHKPLGLSSVNVNRNIQGSDNIHCDCLCLDFCDNKNVPKCLDLSSVNVNRNINGSNNIQCDCLCLDFCDNMNVHKCLDLSSVNVNRNIKLPNGKKHLASAQGRTQGGSIKGEPNNNRPLMQIGILGENGTALLDTGSRGCIAGHTLFRILKEKGHPLQQCTKNIRLADGCTRLMEVLVAKVQVKLFHKIVPTEFIIFPEAKHNESLLGIDFINSAGLVIDFKQCLWHFSDSRDQKYKLILETLSPRHSYAAMNVLRDDEGAGLEDQEREELAQLLMDFQEMFNPIGEPTPYGEHHIDTGNSSPIATPPYRLTPAKKEIMQQELTKMLAEDIIEDCESAWAAPALLVPKRDGSFRFCVDYRKLNSITKTDAYPMPRIDELLQSTKRGRCHMSTIDLRSGYWQVSVKEEDRDKTAFVTPFGTFRFKRMPFGLKNGPATFQRLIDRMRSGSALKDVTILGYLDDLLIITQGDFSRHLEDLRIVFEQLMKFKLRANREKCVFARESVKYLGHVISQEGVSADKEKIQAILDMKEPSSLGHLRTFIQTCSWFRKFIPKFSEVAEPLTRLTRKNQPWIWGPEQAEAFSHLKRLLTSAPILIQADYSKPFILRTDASNYAIGAVLLQGEKNEERPIEFASRLLSAAERNYSTTEREALAVVWAVDRMRGYIDGHPVIIASDHQPLKWLLSLKSPTGRLVRWALKLQAYDIRFEYTPGKVNVVADALSRPVCTDESRGACGICSVIIDLPTRDLTKLRAAQESDPVFNKIIKELEGTEEVSSRRWTERGYLMERGILYRYNPDTDNESPQLVIPVSIRDEILRECHDAPIAGHPGIERTYQKIAQNYYFPGMRRIVTDYVKSCSSCQRYKATNEKPPGLIQTPILNQRNEVLAIDLFGPLPEGENGEKWILLVEDTATRWVEMYALKEATSVACARVLIEEYFLRFGLPRRIISDNGVQFVSAVMQKCMFILGITQDLIPYYHPEANPAERKNRDMKTQLALLVGTDHPSWPKQLPIVRFSMNSAVCETTGATPAYLTFARELRSPLEVYNDPRAVLQKDNFVPQITPYLSRFLNSLSEVRDRVEKLQDRRKIYADRSRRVGPEYKVDDKVLLATHQLSDANKSKTAKFFPKRDGPYVVKKKLSPTTYLIASHGNPGEVLGKFHANQLTPFRGRVDESTQPLEPKKKRGRPRLQPIPNNVNVGLDHDRGRNRDLEGEYVTRQPHDHRVNSNVGRTVSRVQSDDCRNSREVGDIVRRSESDAAIPTAQPAEQAPNSVAGVVQSTGDTCMTRRVSNRSRRTPAILDL